MSISKHNFGSREMQRPSYRYWVSTAALCALVVMDSFSGAAMAAETQAKGSQVLSAQDEGSLTEIIVTAQRKSENLQKVPITVSSFTDDALADANVATALDLNKLAPSVLIAAGTATVTPFMRGVGNNIVAVGNEASVALYIDGIYYARLSPAIFRLNNIERIEAIAGPQGTLFGRNASAGVLQIITRDPKPDDKPSMRASIGYGNYDTKDGTLYASAGLGSGLAADIALVYHNQSDGWGTNIFDGSDSYESKEFVARSKVIADFDDRTQAKLTLTYDKQRGTIGSPNKFFDLPQGFPDGSGRLPLTGFFDLNSDISPEQTTEGYGGSLRLEHDLGAATIAATGSFRNEDQYSLLDLDISPQFFFNSNINSKAKQQSGEIQLTSNGQGDIDYSTGLFYLHQTGAYIPAELFGDTFGPGVSVLSFGRTETSSYAAYAQGSLRITSQLRLTLGGRYSKDKLNADGRTDLSITGLPIIGGVTTTSKVSYGKFSYKAALDYQATPEILAYVSTSRGFKGSTYNILPFSPVPTRPEILTAYEAGIKTEWFGRLLRVNAAAFYYDIKDPQVLLASAANTASVANANKSRAMGVDIDAQMKISSRFSAHASVSFLDSEYKDYPNAPIFILNPNPPFGTIGSVPGSANGNDTPYAPHVTFSVGGSYKIPTSAGEWTLSANYYHNSGMYFQPDNGQRQPSYGLLDARLSYAFGDDRYKLSVYGSNLTDERYYTSAVQLNGPVGIEGAPASPRTYGLVLEARF